MATLIDTYSDSTFVERRVVELHEDHLRLFLHRRFGDIHEQKVWLKDLHAEPSRSWVRSRLFETTVAWATLIALLSLVAYITTRSPDTLDPELLARGIWATIGFVILVIIAYVLMPRRVEMAVFQNTGGIPVIAIARRGHQREHFDPFIAQVAQRIASVQRS